MLDGELDCYLDGLCDELAAEAAGLGPCAGAPEPAPAPR